MGMHCFQCEQTANGACVAQGVCGKTPDVANLQDRLTGELIGLARAAAAGTPTADTDEALLDGLFITVTNVNFDGEKIERYIERVKT